MVSSYETISFYSVNVVVLQRCANDGKTAARAAATAACLVLTNTCLPSGIEEEPRAEIAIASSYGKAPQQILTTGRHCVCLESLEDVVQRSCETVFSQTCRTETFNRAREVNPACASILDHGRQNEARRIFNDHITELCAPSD